VCWLQYLSWTLSRRPSRQQAGPVMLSLHRRVLPMVRTLRILQADGQSSDALPPQEAERILTDAELVAGWRAAEQTGSHFGTIVKLLMLPGQRRGENRRPQGQLLFP